MVLWTIPLIYQYQIWKKKYKKEMDRSNKNFKKYCINAYSKYKCHNGSMLHIPATNLLLLTATQKPYKKSLCLKKLMKNTEEFSG